jgi:antitoxin component YwqK of YwqJK toxin-antitoxin module
MLINIDQAHHGDDLRLLYEGEPFTGEVVETAPNGRIVALTSYSNGMEDGPATQWYADGQLRAKGVVSSGRAVGLHRRWHRNGQLAAEQRYDDNGRELSVRTWDEAGNVIDDRQMQL